MNTKTNTHPQNNPAIQNQAPPSPLSQLEKTILLQHHLFNHHLESIKDLPLTKEDHKDISSILYKLTSSYLQVKSLEVKLRELHLKEEAHKLKYYQPLPDSPSNFAPPPPQSNYPTTETYVPGPTNIQYPGKPDPEPEPIIVTTYESLTPAQRTFIPSLKPSNSPPPPPPIQSQNKNIPPPPPQDQPRDYSLEVRQLIAKGLRRPIPTS